ncbi:hypothetical protein C0Q70_17013 [Pomacea canaliculata]|uniref:C-type lectin domain-containing protein n=1 Tax=Pomacea canaliculata TaxID=400727 RepID=A0A2T7NRD8_POMCA|nr:hypothetical protein C0Q70_17013 [Pomacea canaliculata]
MLCHVIIVAGAVLFLTYGDVTQATGGCGSDWVQLNSACYYVSRTSANWSTAQTYCRENGGTLLSSNYQKEPIQILWNMTRENQQWWVEMQKTSAVTAIPWDRSESTDGEDTRDCAEMDYSGLLNDVQCNSSLYFVCEKRAERNAIMVKKEEQKVVGGTAKDSASTEGKMRILKKIRVESCDGGFDLQITDQPGGEG